MTRILKFLSIVVFSLCGASCFAQSLLVNTTLSAAVTSSSTTTVVLASATGVNAPSASDATKATFLYVDRELMSVASVNGTTIGVIRGQEGTTAAPHASSALVFVIPAYKAVWIDSPSPQGACTRSNEIILPRINPTSGVISDCLGGQWVNGDGVQTTRAVFYRFSSPNTGAQASSAVFGTNSTLTQYSTYCTEIDIPTNKLLTGLAPHIATTGGTDKWTVGLYDSGGNLLASSAAAGATVGSAYAWQATAFSTPYYAVGPAQYFGCFITNGTTATADLVTTAKGDNILTKVITGTGFTLPTSFTPPTSFTTVNGPYLYAY